MEAMSSSTSDKLDYTESEEEGPLIKHISLARDHRGFNAIHKAFILGRDELAQNVLDAAEIDEDDVMKSAAFTDHVSRIIV